MAIETFSFGETDPKKVEELIKPKYEDDDIEEDLDIDVDEEEDDDDVVTYNPTDVIIDDEKPRGMYIGGKGASNSTMVFETDKLRKIDPYVPGEQPEPGKPYLPVCALH